MSSVPPEGSASPLSTTSLLKDDWCLPCALLYHLFPFYHPQFNSPSSDLTPLSSSVLITKMLGKEPVFADAVCSIFSVKLGFRSPYSTEADLTKRKMKGSYSAPAATFLSFNFILARL